MKIVNLISWLLLICSCSQNKSKEVIFSSQIIPKIYTLKSNLNSKTKNDILLINNEKYSGFIYQMQSNNIDTSFIEGYYNGLQSGVTKKWYADGKLMEQRSYFKGKKNGHQIAFWENGNKKFEFTANDDAYEGEMKEWNSDGKLIHLANCQNGQENGTQKLWYDNGKMRANYVIIKGKRLIPSRINKIDTIHC